MKQVLALAIAPLLLVATGCDTRQEGNSTIISVDQNRVEQGVDTVANAAGEAADKAGNAIENAGPALENTADTIGERAERVADKAENAARSVDVDVDVKRTEEPQKR